MNYINGKKGLYPIVIGLLILGLLPFSNMCTLLADSSRFSNWTAQPMHISEYAGVLNPIGYTPTQMRRAYNLPMTGGNGTTIAIVIAYHTPDIQANFNAFCNRFNLPTNNTNTSNLIVHQMRPNIEVKSEWSMEACLDTQWAHAIAPQARILLVEAINSYDESLLEAIDYAVTYPGVVAVSLSWGGEEFSWENRYENYFNKEGIEFFVSSGDDGSKVHWPACSSHVISIGGTTLNLDVEGAIISETAWTNSSGGVSQYIAIPECQSKFGLNYSNRAVPDVSYNGDIETGVAVYNDGWWKVGGTSAGAPQWAAIYAIGRSATLQNLYGSAKNSYTSYFNDISTGANYIEQTSTGYDLVTGLGSPATVNFGTQFMVEPKVGHAQSPITLVGTDFPGKLVNLFYYIAQNQTWIPLASSIPTIDGDFSFQTKAPDTLACNPQGDNPQTANEITFKAIDIDNGKSYYTTFTQFSRGLIQVGESYAEGLYGNNTDLTARVFVQRNDSIILSGRWFKEGTVSFFLDGIYVGNAVVDNVGSFTASLMILGDTPIGKHVLKVNDEATNFVVNITCIPKIYNNFSDIWYTTDFTIPLTPEYPVNEIFYRINNGATLSVSVNGYPNITTEGNQNTIEFWSIWNLNSNITIELPHTTITGIKLDKTSPQATIVVDPIATSENIFLKVTAADTISGITEMRFSLDGINWSNWEPYFTTKAFTIKNTTQTQIIYSQVKDSANLTTTTTCAVTLQVDPIQTVTDQTPTATPVTNIPTINNSIPANTVSPTQTANPSPTVSPTVPEFNIISIILILIMLSLPLIVKLRLKSKVKAFNSYPLAVP